MALFNNGWKGNIITGLAVGIGSTVLAPIIIPILASIAKPVAKASIKSGLMLYEKGREAVAEAQEVMEDLVAEARSELAAVPPAETSPGEQLPESAVIRP